MVPHRDDLFLLFVSTLIPSQALLAKRWVERSTRAVSFEFAIFNPNVNLFSQVKLLIEMPASGGIFPIARYNKALHYGTKPGHSDTSKIHFPTSEGVSEVSERAKPAVRSKRMS